MATIRIVDLKVRTIIGTHPWERKNQQDLVINVIIEYDAFKPGRSDDLKDALDYERIANKIMQKVEISKFHLLEKIGAKLLELVLADKRVVAAAIKIDKPHAIAAAKHVSYEINGKN